MLLERSYDQVVSKINPKTWAQLVCRQASPYELNLFRLIQLYNNHDFIKGAFAFVLEKLSSWSKCKELGRQTYFAKLHISPVRYLCNQHPGKATKIKKML